jgi:hypothetical protein
VTAEEHIARATELLERLEELRGELERTEDSDAALELLTEISDLAKEAHSEIERAKRESDAHA